MQVRVKLMFWPNLLATQYTLSRNSPEPSLLTSENLIYEGCAHILVKLARPPPPKKSTKDKKNKTKQNKNKNKIKKNKKWIVDSNDNNNNDNNNNNDDDNNNNNDIR